MALTWKKRLKIVGGVTLLLALSYLLLLCFPHPLFVYKYSTEGLNLYCDDPIPPEAGRVLSDVHGRLKKSPLDEGRPTQNIFICNHRWRYLLLTNINAGGGGVAYGFFPSNVYLRKSDIARNILFRPSGEPAGPDRPLSYFIAHEITHNLTSRFLGPLVYWRLPAWKREGYADYVGKGGNFDFKKNLELFREKDPTLNPQASGLYLRYHLLVAELLDRKGISVQALLQKDFDPIQLEKELQTRNLKK
jgi:hypothetical protein